MSALLEIENLRVTFPTARGPVDVVKGLSLTLGRHSNDDMLSFYPMTPSGFDVEYGWGGLEVDDETWHVLTHAKNSAWGHHFQRPPRPAKKVEAAE